MRYTGTEPAVAQLADAAWVRMPKLVESAFTKIVTEIPVYRNERFVSHGHLRTSCEENLRFLVGALRESGTPDLSKAVDTGRERARQGAPLPELLRAFRIGFTEVWQSLVELAEADGDTDVLVAATRGIWALIDDYTEALTSAYRETVAAIVRTQHEKRLALLEALFSGATATQGVLWEIAGLLDLSLDGTFVVVAAQTPGLGQEPLPGIENALRQRHHASAWRLSPELQAGVVSLRAPEGAEPVLALLKENATGRVGVSPVFSGLGNTARALHLARVALAGAMPGTVEVVQFTESPLAGLVASDPEASAHLAHQVLRPLLELPPEDRNVLLLTLRAWFDCRGSTKLVAERVFCHPNTVRHRLKKITDELGRSLADPADIAELGTALRALTLFPETAQLPRN
ncbi:helix-turn-helix domain-containing protein [Amycolatopsis cynarae]|uniref:Helix-turn-helix domain-containing protein n=1 Tax=Amycolatopsis cynarae TaxID=2995223 RepID=A0ABY7B5A5_9PSEU|nr:helix-turn-helix domain-containing protein [Amycolatopsis sp. HUAS 11-8]WAL67485.1 helix-turn-helix domain-containing protein [Amycolatopsis sp. HUAS 11-8]